MLVKSNNTTQSSDTADILAEIEWARLAGWSNVAAECLNCRDIASKPVILRAPWPDASSGTRRIGLLHCPGCGCAFFHPALTGDYTAVPAGGRSALAFYLQQGAGLCGITANISSLGMRPGTRLLEVGCGFGFGLDYARRALGWDVRGLDPSPFAAAGRVALKLPIESRYLVANEPGLGGHFDVVMASEVIEHVSSPRDFLWTLRSALCDDGTLVLTTPDVEAVRPDTPRGILAPLLSLGYHLVLQSQASLSALLQNVGFVDIDVRRAGGAQLTARCRRASVLKDRSKTDPIDCGHRERYRGYLNDAAAAAERDGDLWFGLTARAYREAVNAGDNPAANTLWTALAAACAGRFGFNPDAGIAPDPARETLESLAEREPLCLGPLLLHRAFHRLHSGESRSAVEVVFRQAADACTRLRRALQQIGSDDGDAEDLGWLCGAEELLCAAERGAKDVPERFEALGMSPADGPALRDGQAVRTEHYRRRIYVSLVNADRLQEADRLADVVAEVEARATVPDACLGSDDFDVLFCASARELQRHKRGAERALGLLRLFDAACTAARAAGRATPTDQLVKLARERQIVALNVLGRSQEAKALRRSGFAGLGRR